jgi:hypothetical protein
VAELQEPGEDLIVATWRSEAALRASDLLARPSDVVVHRISSTVHARDPNPPEPGLFG